MHYSNLNNRYKGKNMKDNLQDLIEHTSSLGNIELIKITGTDTETQISSVSEDKSVIINGKFNSPSADFIGTFGMPNLGKLKTILGFDDYDEHAVINVTRQNKDGEDVPTAIHFETKTKDFVNDYRLMAKAIIEEKVKSPTFKGAVWNISFEPTIAGILRLKKQHQANSEETTFATKTENGDLRIYFGDPSTHSGNFVFYSGVTGSLARSFMWPVKVFLAIMDLSGDKIVKISDQGVAEITVDSGVATYQYLLPGQVK
jgi:hypothetical protein